MIISRGRNYIFVHIPKTGGTSLALALEGRAMADDIMLGDTPKARKRRHRVKGVASAGRLWKHSTLRDIDGLVSRAEVADAFVFTLVRNPWDRLVSYYHWLGKQSFDHPAVAAAVELDFGTFLQEPQVARGIEANPYSSYVLDAEGVERCNLFLRLEHLAEDVTRLEAGIDVRLGDMPHVNRSERPEYREAYTPQTRAHVARMCAGDIARFGYCF